MTQPTPLTDEVIATIGYRRADVDEWMMMREHARRMERDRALLREALLVTLDQVDYTRAACALTEMVGACLPTAVIDRARAALAATEDK